MLRIKLLQQYSQEGKKNQLIFLNYLAHFTHDSGFLVRVTFPWKSLRFLPQVVAEGNKLLLPHFGSCYLLSASLFCVPDSGALWRNHGNIVIGKEKGLVQVELPLTTASTVYHWLPCDMSLIATLELNVVFRFKIRKLS